MCAYNARENQREDASHNPRSHSVKTNHPGVTPQHQSPKICTSALLFRAAGLIKRDDVSGSKASHGGCHVSRSQTTPGCAN
eukprot:3932975-Rhodomonas_salina.1